MNWLTRQKFMHLAAGALILLLITQIVINLVSINMHSQMLGADAYERINIKMLDIVKDTVTIILLYFFGRNQKQADSEKTLEP